jgi:hypothetical protein
MDGDERQIGHFFIGVSRRAHHWLDVLRFLLVPWRFRRLGVRATCSRAVGRLQLRTQ